MKTAYKLLSIYYTETFTIFQRHQIDVIFMVFLLILISI